MKFSKHGVIALTFVLAGIFLSTGSATAQDIKIGILTPLTAGAHQLGKEAVRGAKMGVEYINAKGGVLGRKLKLIVEDDAGQVEKAVSGFRKLTSRDKVVAVIGQIHSSNMLALIPLSKKTGVPVFSTQASSNKITESGARTVFRTAAIGNDRIDTYLGFIKQQGFKKIAMVAENTDYGIGQVELMKKLNSSQNIGLSLKTYVFDKNTRDLTPQLLQIKNWKPDLVLNVGVGDAAYLIIKQAYDIKLFPEAPMVASYDFPTQPIFWDTLGDKGKYLNYISYGHPAQKLTALGNWFKKEFKKRHDDEPIFGASNAFGQIVMIAEAIYHAGSAKSADIIQALEDYHYDNFNGPVKFNRVKGVRWHQSSPPVLIIQYTAKGQSLKDGTILYPPTLKNGTITKGMR